MVSSIWQSDFFQQTCFEKEIWTQINSWLSAFQITEQTNKQIKQNIKDPIQLISSFLAIQLVFYASSTPHEHVRTIYQIHFNWIY